MSANDIETALRARAAFNDSVERIDADTLRRLRELRTQAQRKSTRRARWMWPTGAALTAALVLVVLVQRVPQTHVAITPAATIAISQPAAALAPSHSARGRIESIADVIAPDPIEAADPEMLSDIEFYGWLAKQPNANASGD